MIIDTSAIIAILRNEADARRYTDALAESPQPRMSAATLVEVGIVVDTMRNPVIRARLEALLEQAGIAVEPFTQGHAQIAREAYREYGRSSGHPARLSFGDCFSYALARASGEALLYKGTDFAQTDIASALDERE